MPWTVAISYKGRGTVLVVTEKTGSTPYNTIGQICDNRQLLFAGSGRWASRADAACDNVTSGRMNIHVVILVRVVSKHCTNFLNRIYIVQNMCVF